jgi:hypothetical protein
MDMEKSDRGHDLSGATYEIRMWGELDQNWADWFNGMKLTRERGPDGRVLSTLRGFVVDQAKLRGILARIWNLNLVLVSVTRLDRAESQGHERKGHERKGEGQDGEISENGVA